MTAANNANIINTRKTSHKATLTILSIIPSTIINVQHRTDNDHKAISPTLTFPPYILMTIPCSST